MKSAYRIGELREKRGLTQTELANKIGLSQQTMCYYETGRSDIKASICIAMANALGVSVDELLGVVRDEPESDLADDEKRLVELYRGTNKQGRAAIMAVAESQSGNMVQYAPPCALDVDCPTTKPCTKNYRV